ncbi:MAG TPA: AAA domain-containing protein, partial [Planctomycetota bacterium]|nr:AAA domain-containing protein [Planctomycetota bacterium]
ASQVRPVDAFGAILRGRQLVVVGDDKQMPPTSFFDHMLSPEGPGGEEEGEGSPTADLQSILGLCVAKGMPSRMLRWHYRSRHDSLIALSNREFYEDGLVVFPSPRRRGAGEGLEYRHLPGTAYERGTTRTNPKEAEAVAAAVYEHWKTRPALSLGVVAFSMAQREAIEERIEALQKKDAAFDAWASEARDEPFFVKNLENVQGDERDVMLISVGYGRDEKGAVTMNFGPLNQAGGERRLNVLITRAKRRCAVFTNLQPEDIDLRRAPGEGVRALRAFLAFARDGRLESAGVTAVGARDDVRAQVRAALQAAGYEVKEDVGSGGYRVDLAVEDPASPGRFLIGIELDGPRYQEARWARDRDRLRESVLRGLGWSLHRVWSTDWFLNREAAQRRCVSAIERAKAAPAVPAAPAPPGGLKRDGRTPPPGRSPVPPYVPAKATADIGEQHIADVDAVKRAAFVAAIVDREAPMHVEELRRRILEAIDARPGSKRFQAIDEAVDVAVARALIRRKGDFLWSKDDRIVTPRDRSGLPDASRDLARVSDEECEAALLRVVEEAHGCDADEAAAQAIRLLGVKRTESAFERLRSLSSNRILSSTPPAPQHESVARG